MTLTERENLRRALEKFEAWLSGKSDEPPDAPDTRLVVSFAVWQFARISREAEKSGEDRDPFRVGRMDRFAMAALQGLLASAGSQDPVEVAEKAWEVAQKLDDIRPSLRTGLPPKPLR